VTSLAVSWRASPNHDTRGDRPRTDMLVLHYTGMQSADVALERLCDPAARVSAHYVVEEDGRIWQLVPEGRRAFHAGISCWQGERDLNLVSIGVEIVNPGHDWGYRPFPEAQMLRVEQLCADILRRHPIPADRVVGHSDIAPDRKSDPGERFDWRRLARAGIGLWPEPAAPVATQTPDPQRALADLATIGYCVGAGAQVIAAFQRRFRPSWVNGIVDCETAHRAAEVSAEFARVRGRAARRTR
jgi:N-acetylmuramoyl-L-alanine amidase